MHECLRRHPQIYMSPRKEPLFFAEDLPDLPGRRISTPEEYIALFDGARAGQLLGEASPYYLYSEHAVHAIRRQCANARVVIMLRNPADMMYSMYWAWSYAGFDDSPTFEEAIDPRRFRAPNQSRFLLDYRHFARYSSHVARYLDAFGEARVHIVVFDDFVRDTSRVYRELCRFLGVSPDHQPPPTLDVIQRASARRPLSRRLARFVTACRPSDHRLVARRAMPLVRDALRRWGSVAPPPLDADTRRRIQREYASEIRLLGDLIGRDLSAWCV
jgi:hypothetical protein